jgi:fatty-acyl-CoA synthase
MSGGGPTPEVTMRPYRERGATFVQGYGLTEGGPNNLYVDPGRPDAHARDDHVGRPFPDCRIQIVDEDGAPVETGRVGELEVAGPVTAASYLETSDGTFEGAWVSTGDLATRDETGDIAIVGRTDNMFVSGGENVHPESIERALESHPAVEAAGVIGIPDERWGTVPRAIVVAAVEESALRNHVAERLADYEQPTEYRFVDALPRGGPGKLDRQALEDQFGQ